MTRSPRPLLLGIAFAVVLAGCGASKAPANSGSGAAATPPSSPTATSTASATPTPPGPYAVVLTNAQRAGSAYDILLVDPAGQIVARTAATLPTRKVGELGLELPLISASDTAVYYLDGNTDIRSLSPSGATADVMAIPDGAAAEIAFAVSPDGRRIAITELTERPDPSKDSSEAYIEDLRSGSNRVWLWTDNRGGSATRWPVGWHGNSLIDAIYPNQCPHGQCLGLRTPNGYNPPGAYHVFDSTTGNVSATVCQSPPPPSNSIYADYYNAEGLPTASGTACYEILQGGIQGMGRTGRSTA